MQLPGEWILFQRFWVGPRESERNRYSRRDDGAFAVADDESLADVTAEFERGIQWSRAIVSRFNFDDTMNTLREGIVSMRWMMLLIMQEFARHAGRGDILANR